MAKADLSVAESERDAIAAGEFSERARSIGRDLETARDARPTRTSLAPIHN